MKDYVYYLYINGEIQTDIIFSSEQEAIDFADANAVKDYDVVRWDVD